MPKILNTNYREFLDKGFITLISREDVERAQANIKGKNAREGRNLLTALYYTGARPCEVVELQGRHITKEKNYVKIQITLGAKHGYPRIVLVSQRFRIAKELYNYANSLYPDQYLFFHYRGKYKKVYHSKTKGDIIYTVTSGLVRYHVLKWFKGVWPGGVIPYLMRHNKISQLSMDGASDNELQQFKGARDPKSIQPYKHMSRKSATNLARINK